MNLFKGLFSGKNNDKNNDTDYLTRAYDSLEDESQFDPDLILGGSVQAVEPEVWDTPKLMNDSESAALDTDSAENGAGDLADIGADEPESHEDEAYSFIDDISGDTGEMNSDEIRKAAKDAERIAASDDDSRYDSFLRELDEADDGSPFSGTPLYSPGDTGHFDDMDRVDEEAYSSAPHYDGEVDQELLYSAYAPKSMRPAVTETSYYDLNNPEPAAEPEERERGFKAFCVKNKKWLIGAGAAAAVVLIVLISVIAVQSRVDPLMGYSETYASKGNVIKTMSAGGNVEPIARYNITSLVGGTITESPLNAGEAVKAGELVYKVDDTNAQLAVQQAENAVKKATSTSVSASDSVNIYANATGTISGLNISAGSKVTGGQIATITQANGTEIGLIPNISGTVQRVNVRNGSSVTSGQVVATLRSSSVSSEAERELDQASSQLALEQAKKELEKYKLASPIDGTILVKNAKIGDNVQAGAEQPLMVIADMSRMKLTIEVDELDIWNIEQGQTVVVTANALPGETFSGEITNIAGEGVKKGDGVTVYPVEITISEPGKIKSGMNVDAKIIVNSAINVLSLPKSALYESDGKNALVVTDAAVSEKDIEAPEDHPDIAVPKGYKLVRVEYGVSDGENVEIKSGIAVGDSILYMEDAVSDLVEALPQSSAEQDGAEAAEPSAGDNGENIRSTGKSATTEGLTTLD